MRLPILAALGLCLATPALADWQQTLNAAKGQTVYWNAWGGDERTNAFIAWVGSETERLYGVKVEQVKLTDTAEAITRVLSEKAAGQTEGSVDLIWINGPNFLAMKEQGLLHGPFVAGLPNAKYLDLSAKAPAAVDFTVPVDGMESPWRLAKFVFVADTARAGDLPLTVHSVTGYEPTPAGTPITVPMVSPSRVVDTARLRNLSGTRDAATRAATPK